MDLLKKHKGITMPTTLNFGTKSTVSEKHFELKAAGAGFKDIVSQAKSGRAPLLDAKRKAFKEAASAPLRYAGFASVELIGKKMGWDYSSTNAKRGKLHAAYDSEHKGVDYTITSKKVAEDGSEVLVELARVKPNFAHKRAMYATVSAKLSEWRAHKEEAKAILHSASGYVFALAIGKTYVFEAKQWAKEKLSNGWESTVNHVSGALRYTVDSATHAAVSTAAYLGSTVSFAKALPGNLKTVTGRAVGKVLLGYETFTDWAAGKIDSVKNTAQAVGTGFSAALEATKNYTGEIGEIARATKEEAKAKRAKKSDNWVNLSELPEEVLDALRKLSAERSNGQNGELVGPEKA